MASYIITCASCGTANRIPADKEGLVGRCGHCRRELPPLYYQPQAMNERNFEQFVRTYPGPILAEFWAPW